MDALWKGTFEMLDLLLFDQFLASELFKDVLGICLMTYLLFDDLPWLITFITFIIYYIYYIYFLQVSFQVNRFDHSR